MVGEEKFPLLTLLIITFLLWEEETRKTLEILRSKEGTDYMIQVLEKSSPDSHIQMS